MQQEPIFCDGWRARMHNNVLLRWNPTHIEKCRDAIRRRWDNETQHTIEPDNVVSLTYVRKCSRVNT